LFVHFTESERDKELELVEGQIAKGFLQKENVCVNERKRGRERERERERKFVCKSKGECVCVRER
jgi:hypothetical protein